MSFAGIPLAASYSEVFTYCHFVNTACAFICKLSIIFIAGISTSNCDLVGTMWTAKLTLFRTFHTAVTDSNRRGFEGDSFKS